MMRLSFSGALRGLEERTLKDDDKFISGKKEKVRHVVTEKMDTLYLCVSTSTKNNLKFGGHVMVFLNPFGNVKS